MNTRDASAARLAMVESQLRTNQVTDPALLGAFAEVPREEFLPQALRGVAYVDDDLPLGNGAWLMEPMILARLLQAAALSGAHVLVIGDPTGYAATIAARLARSVTMIESDAALAAAARARFSAQGVGGVTVVESAAAKGHAAAAPYDAIVIAGAIATVPQEIGEQLVENGKLVTVLREQGKTMGEGAIVTRTGKALSHRPFCDAGTPYLPGFAPAPSFAF